MAQNPRTEGLSAVERTIELGMMAGMAAAVPMGIFALIASGTWQHAGVYTPVYRIAAMLDPSPLEVSLEEAAAGSSAYFDPQPFFSGGVVHLALGGFYGVIFALLVHRFRWRGRLAGAGWPGPPVPSPVMRPTASLERSPEVPSRVARRSWEGCGQTLRKGRTNARSRG